MFALWFIGQGGGASGKLTYGRGQHQIESPRDSNIGHCLDASIRGEAGQGRLGSTNLNFLKVKAGATKRAKLPVHPRRRRHSACCIYSASGQISCTNRGPIDMLLLGTKPIPLIAAGNQAYARERVAAVGWLWMEGHVDVRHGRPGPFEGNRWRW